MTQRDHEKHHTRKGAVARAADGDHRIIIKAGQMLAQFGAESRIIEQTTVRLGMALGLESVEMAISSSAIVLTSLYQGSCVTTTRRVQEHASTCRWCAKSSASAS